MLVLFCLVAARDVRGWDERALGAWWLYGGRGERAWEHQRPLESVRGGGGRWISGVARSGAWKTNGQSMH
ncbi:hypothetical protein GQ457_11G028330 [Hibiscus cannabinus]